MKHFKLYVLVGLLALSASLALFPAYRIAFATCTPVTVTSVTGNIAPSNSGWTLTIEGCGFGSTFTASNTYADGSVTTAPSATTGAIVLVDQGSSGGTNLWSAGFGGDNIGLIIQSWSDTKIVLAGFGGLCSSPNCPGGVSTTPDADQYLISLGDKIFIYIVGGDCTASGWTSTSATPPGYNTWPESCQPVSSYIAANGGVDPNLWGIPVTVATPPSGVPEFPMGLLALFLIAVPMMILFKNRFSIKLR